MSFEWIDRYLLGEPVSKRAVIDRTLNERVSVPAAAPFYRALEAVGARADDMALVALRLVLAGREPSDENVRRLRALSTSARDVRKTDGERSTAFLQARDAYNGALS